MRRRYVYLCIFAAYLVVLGLPSVLPVQSDFQKLSNMALNDARTAQATVAGIFGNNMLIALFSLIPMFGFGWLFLISWQTGLVAASYLSVGLLVYVNPFTWVEFGLYAYLAYNSFFIFQKLKVKDRRGAFNIFRNSLVLAVSVLLISAFVEIALLKVVNV